MPTMEPITPRPTLVVDNLCTPDSLYKKRKSALRKAMGPPSPESNRVLAKYRTRQTKLLGKRDDDPHPYSPRYVFYCLDSPPSE